MSDLEKIRAVSLLSTIALILVGLFALQADWPSSALSAPQALQLCATSKGALCPDPDAHLAPDAASIETLGAMTVVAGRAEAHETALQLARAPESTTPRTAQAVANF